MSWLRARCLTSHICHPYSGPLLRADTVFLATSSVASPSLLLAVAGSDPQQALWLLMAVVCLLSLVPSASAATSRDLLSTACTTPVPKCRPNMCQMKRFEAGEPPLPFCQRCERGYVSAFGGRACGKWCHWQLLPACMSQTGSSPPTLQAVAIQHQNNAHSRNKLRNSEPQDRHLVCDAVLLCFTETP